MSMLVLVVAFVGALGILPEVSVAVISPTRTQRDPNHVTSGWAT